ncbi:MAG TPA: protein kinase, partial [Gemmataceae bacterium]|nr:protein kinase [Gemmataceae bacterium]
AERNPVDKLAEEFAARCRAGESPSVSEYAARYPELADEIRDVFPALLAMEQLKPANNVLTSPVENPPAAPTDEPALPSRLGEYRLLREVGRGGMGVVYEAVQESLGRHVALKVLPGGALGGPTHLERFRREARAAGRLHHTNIVPVFGTGECDGVHYYAMQFIPGQALDNVLHDLRRLRQPHHQEDENLPGKADLTGSVAWRLCSGEITDPVPGDEVSPADPPTSSRTSQTVVHSAHISGLSGVSEGAYYRSVARVGLQVAEALAYAHRQGVLHRDVKPSNLLLDPQGTVWVTDFGLAKADDSDGLTGAGDVVGTLRYMAPERFDGKSLPQGDVYGLGLTLYELLTLRPAFDEVNRGRLIERILHQGPPPPRQTDPRVPRDLETIVLKCVAKDPRERYPSAEALAEDLRRFLADRPVLARRASWRERLWRWSRRNPVVAALAAAVTVLLVLIAAGSSLFALHLGLALKQSEENRDRAEDNSDRAERAEWETRQQLELTKKAEHKARLELGKSLLAQGATGQYTGLIGQRFDSLDLLSRAARELRDDPEGRKLLPEVRTRALTALGLVDLRTHCEHEAGLIHRPGCDRKLKRYAVAMQASEETVVRSMTDGRELVRLPNPGVRFWYAACEFSSDGRFLRIMYEPRDREGRLVDVWNLGGRPQLVFRKRTPGGGGLLHPNSRWLVYTDPDGRGLVVWDLFAWKELKHHRLAGKLAESWCLDAQGQRAAFNDAEGDLHIVDLDTGRELAVWKVNTAGAWSHGWSADGRLLALGTGEGPVYVWDVTTQRLVSQLQGHTSNVIGCRFARQGHLLATESWDTTIRLWDASTGEALVAATGQLIDFSSDGRRLAYLKGNQIGVWEVTHDRECLTLNPALAGNRSEARAEGTAQDAAFSPDGRLLAVATPLGVPLYEADTGRALAVVPAGNCGCVLFHPDGRSLVTYGERGLFRWPVQPDPQHGPDALRVGPPQFLSPTTPGSTSWKCAWVPGHRQLAMTDNPNARVLLIDAFSPNARPPLILPAGQNHRMTSIAISPDGRWAAAGGFKEQGVHVWDLQRRRLERILPPSDVKRDTLFWVAFSPDGRWLISNSSNNEVTEHRIWHVGTWQLERVIPGHFGNAMVPPIFSPDGRLMAVPLSPQELLLAEQESGREVVRLTALRSIKPGPLAFSSNGRLAVATGQRTVQVWDLRRVRGHLARLELDDDRLPGPPIHDEEPGEVPPLRSVQVLGEAPEPAIRRQVEVLEIGLRQLASPFDAEAQYRRGCLLMPERKWTDAAAAFTLAATLPPGHPDAQRMLAEVRMREGNPVSALTALSRHLEADPGDDESRLRRAKLALSLGQARLAAEDLGRVLDRQPHRNDALYHRARARVRLGLARDALADLDSLLVDYPRDHELYTLRAEAHERLGHADRARADREQVARLLPGEAGKCNNEAWRCVTGLAADWNPERALPLARKAVELSPNDANR